MKEKQRSDSVLLGLLLAVSGGCIFVFAKGKCICQCTDRKYSLAWCTSIGRKGETCSGIFMANPCLYAGNCGNRYGSASSGKGKSRTLETGLSVTGDCCIIFGKFCATEHEPICQRTDLFCLWNTGGKLSNHTGEWNCYHHVYR